MPPLTLRHRQEEELNKKKNEDEIGQQPSSDTSHGTYDPDMPSPEKHRDLADLTTYNQRTQAKRFQKTDSFPANQLPQSLQDKDWSSDEKMPLSPDQLPQHLRYRYWSLTKEISYLRDQLFRNPEDRDWSPDEKMPLSPDQLSQYLQKRGRSPTGLMPLSRDQLSQYLRDRDLSQDEEMSLSPHQLLQYLPAGNKKVQEVLIALHQRDLDQLEKDAALRRMSSPRLVFWQTENEPHEPQSMPDLTQWEPDTMITLQMEGGPDVQTKAVDEFLSFLVELQSIIDRAKEES